MTKEEVFKAALELETKENLLGGDIWVDIESEKYPNGIFLHFEEKELNEGAYGYGETFCIYGYENKLLNGEIKTDYSNTLIDFEFTRKELDEFIEIKDLPYGEEFLKIMLDRSYKHNQVLQNSYNETFDKYKELLNIETNLKKYVNSITDDIKTIDNEEFLTSTDLVELEVLQNVKSALNNILNNNSKNTQALDEIKELMNSSQNKDEKAETKSEQTNIRRNK